MKPTTSWFAELALLVLALPFNLAGRLYPRRMAKFLIGLERRRARLVAGRMPTRFGDVVYLSGGNPSGETILLVHGIGGSKDHFTRVAAGLTSKHRVVAVDLPGFGESGRDGLLPYDVPAQAERLKEIVTALHLERFHLAGSSMGGFVSMVYAAKYPDDVKSLWLLNPAGVAQTKPSEMVSIAIRTGRSPLFARRSEELDEIFALVFANAPKLPWCVRRVTAERMIADEPLHQKIFDAVRRSEPIDLAASRIQAPVLIVWGSDDRVLDVSGGELLVKLLPRARLVVMPGVGHLPMLEAPALTVAGYLDFLGELARSDGAVVPRSA
jgi:pimeloyl-ACP methyl ester carboxylesterase